MSSNVKIERFSDYDGDIVGEKRVKRVLDVTAAILGLLILSPLFILISILIKIEDGGPVFYKQGRYGRDKKIFHIYKFRSMKVCNADAFEQAKKSDPRITRIGKFIRKSSIDELPQLFNILNGTMSLVGPRPHHTDHDDAFSSKIDGYDLRYAYLPGLTGYAQIKGYRGETDTIEKMHRRIQADIFYIKNWSIWLDIKIILMTPFICLTGKNAH